MFCPHCGHETLDEAKFCPKCGQAVPNLQTIQQPTNSSSNTTRIYAGFWIRTLALLLDSIFLGAGVFIIGIIIFVVSYFMSPASTGVGTAALMYVISIIGSWLYNALMESSSLQATLGKKIVGIKVTDLYGRRIGFGRATGRYFSKIVSGLIVYVGYMLAGWSAKKQALHDMMAGCLVVKKDTSVVMIEDHRATQSY